MLALELRQFAGKGLKTIVPTVYGQTEEARQRKEMGHLSVNGMKNQYLPKSVVGLGQRRSALRRELRNG